MVWNKTPIPIGDLKMMKHAWDKQRVENHIATYGPPDNPNPNYKNRMLFASKQIIGDSVLDVACGLGHLYHTLKPKTLNYKGIDSSKEMIMTAREKAPDGLFAVGDAYDLSEEGMYDTVIAMSLLIHIEKKDLQHIIEQMWTHTRKALVFTIPVDKDFSKTVELSRKIPEASGTTLITHVSEKTLDGLLNNFKMRSVERYPFPEGCFGYGLNDYLIRIWKRR